MSDELFQQAEQKMQQSLNVLKNEFSGLRGGRANTRMLETIQVDAYGSMMPLSQVASISVPEARMLLVSVWDQNMSKPIEKAIAESGLALNPIAEGATIRVNIPELTEERRLDLIKVAHKYAEGAKIAVRNVRRDILDTIKQQGKDGEIGKDDVFKLSDKAQKVTDKYTAIIDELMAEKEKDIRQV